MASEGTRTGVPRRIEWAAASSTSPAAFRSSRVRSRSGPSAGAPTRGSAREARTGRMRSARPRGPCKAAGRRRACHGVTAAASRAVIIGSGAKGTTGSCRSRRA